MEHDTSTPLQNSSALTQAVPPQQTLASIPPQQSSASVSPQQSSAAGMHVATPEAALQKLEKNSGLVLSTGAKVFSHGDGGVPDPSIGFYEWVIVSPTPLALPNGRQIGDNEVLSLPVAEAARFIESKMSGAKVENPQTAFSTGWQMNGFEFSGTWLRAQGADYLIVQQTRK